MTAPPALLLAAAMLLVGSYVGLSKALVVVFPIFLLAGIRFGIAAVAMLAWLRKPAAEERLDTRDRWALFFGSFFGNFLFSICMLFGVQATSALAAGVVMAGIPAMVALQSRLLLGEPLHRHTVAAIVCAGLGIGLLAFSRDPGSAAGADAPWWGYALLLGAVACEGAYVVLGKRLSRKLAPKRISALINLWGLVLVAPLALWQAFAQAPAFDFAGPRAVDWGLLVFYALAASVVSVWLWMKGLEGMPANRAGVFAVFLPLGSAGVGIFWLGEHAGWLHAVALAFALAGVWLATRPDQAPSKRRHQDFGA